jgi:hypothetical protein
MSSSAIVVNTTTLVNPNGAATDYCLYALDPFGTQLYAGGWLNGENASPSNPNGTGLDRIYVSSSDTLDDFSQVTWTISQAPGTWNDAYTSTLYDEGFDAASNSYVLQPYYGPGEALDGSIYYQVNDPTVVAEGANLVMFMTAVPNQNEYSSTTTVEPNGNPNYQIGWCQIGYAVSSNDGATWTWEGTLPLLQADGTPLLAPVLLAFPTDPTVQYPLDADGNSSPTAVFNASTGLDLWYTNLTDNGSLATSGTPVLWLSSENRDGVWAAPQPCELVTSSGTMEMNVVDQDVHVASDGSGTLWMVVQQWGGVYSGALEAFYSSTADGAKQGIDWHPWDGADGVLVVGPNQDQYDGLYDFITPAIVSAGNGTLTIDYSVPTNTSGLPIDYNQINQTFILPCFGAGTRLLTCRGEVAVESLQPGDRVLIARETGALRPVIWVGHRTVDCRHHADPQDIWPIRITAHAFGLGRPHRDLFLSPDHAVWVADVLIPIRCLVNGATIRQEPRERVSYWHVELDRHDLVLAEGLACESYLDTGNRGAFENGGGAVVLHPDFARRVWDGEACAAQIRGGPQLIEARRRLLVQATMLGHAVTDQPELRVLAHGRQLATEIDGRHWHVRVPNETASARIVSRVWIPAHVLADKSDRRSLGVAVSRLWLDGREVGLDSPGLVTGWHVAEPGGRWTDGDAEIALAGVRDLAFELAMTGIYWQCGPGAAARGRG